VSVPDTVSTAVTPTGRSTAQRLTRQGGARESSGRGRWGRGESRAARPRAGQQTRVDDGATAGRRGRRRAPAQTDRGEPAPGASTGRPTDLVAAVSPAALGQPGRDQRRRPAGAAVPRRRAAAGRLPGPTGDGQPDARRGVLSHSGQLNITAVADPDGCPTWMRSPRASATPSTSARRDRSEIRPRVSSRSATAERSEPCCIQSRLSSSVRRSFSEPTCSCAWALDHHRLDRSSDRPPVAGPSRGCGDPGFA
jgi:hypothetical protein